MASAPPFRRMKVHLKKEIVTMKVQGVDPLKQVGTYVAPTDWNALISEPETLVIDTRNDYEFAIGTFDGAIEPETKNFRDFPAWVQANRERLEGAEKIAMFCTGGIRCEKATSYLLDAGYEDVFHLKGGILKYLEDVPQEDSLWRGDCFVFDERVSVKHGLIEGDYDLCHACRHPIDDEDKRSDDYIAGVSCPHCAATTTDDQKARFGERHKQIALAAARNEVHLGKDPRTARKAGEGS